MSLAVRLKNGLIVAYFAMSSILGCSTGDMNQDAQAGDGGTPSPIDAGVRALCPVGNQATCQSAMECGEIKPAPTNCRGCIPYCRSICRLGQCETPLALKSADPHNYLFQVGILVGRLQSFAGVALTAESSGGKLWTCDDVYSENLDLTSMCHNILDTRGQDIGRIENQYTVTFTRFAANQPTLFVVYGYADPGAVGTPIGVSCGFHEVGSPGEGLKSIPGDTMQGIQ